MTSLEKSVHSCLEEIQVYDCNLSKTRIGNNCDGGYIALDEICKSSTDLLSFGIEDNVTFELDFVTRYPHVHAHLFDHTITNLPQDHSNFRFIKKGVGPKTTHELESLADILASAPSNLTLKMDIEWDEWKTFATLADWHYEKIDQLLIEFHLASIDTDQKFIPNLDEKYKLTPYFCNFYKSIYDKINEDLFQMYRDIFSVLNEKFYAFHIHPNNSLQKIEVGGHSFPPLLEMSFVRKDLVENAEKSVEKYPVQGLDFPNKPYKKELKNYYPLI